ncbi:dihydroorotase [Kordiimonas marina]|uniref:dihydroorotase n=1 Tax=Kordiimonas marina TaxID=2872312 RepID=UPI001FF2E5AA|nr:dihydroorotase [Kordiimonas marina]MCJ9429221.1 dihydroorotase [Kordiimonas marina]
MSVLYKNARLIDPATGLDEKGALLIDGDVIVALGQKVDAPADAEVVDCKGRVLAPGLIDMRAHRVDSDSALAGGITTVILQPDQTTIIDTDPVVERIRRRSDDTHAVRVYPMGAATKGLEGTQVAEIGQMQESGAVAFTDCRHAISDTQLMRRLMEYAGYFGALIVQFPEDKSLANGAVAHEGEIATRLGLAGVPAAAEAIQIDRDVRLAELTGARIHFAMISSREGVEAIRAAKKRGVKVTCSTAPHYLHLNDNALEGYRTFAKVSPPFRAEEDRLALIAALADGTIDTVVSDHDPRSEDVKRLPFGQAAPGIVGFETLLALTLAPVHAGKIELMTALKALTSTPAQLLGLDSGRLSAGAPADIVIFDPDKPWRIEREKFRSSARNTPFDTLPVQGKVWRTIVGGKTLFEGE